MQTRLATMDYLRPKALTNTLRKPSQKRYNFTKQQHGGEALSPGVASQAHSRNYSPQERQLVGKTIHLCRAGR